VEENCTNVDAGVLLSRRFKVQPGVYIVYTTDLQADQYALFTVLMTSN